MTKEDYIREVNEIKVEPHDAERWTTWGNYYSFWKIAIKYFQEYNDDSLLKLLSECCIRHSDRDILRSLILQRFDECGLDGVYDLLSHTNLHEGAFRVNTCGNLVPLDEDDWESLRSRFYAVLTA